MQTWGRGTRTAIQREKKIRVTREASRRIMVTRPKINGSEKGKYSRRSERGCQSLAGSLSLQAQCKAEKTYHSSGIDSNWITS